MADSIHPAVSPALAPVAAAPIPPRRAVAECATVALRASSSPLACPPIPPVTGMDVGIPDGAAPIDIRLRRSAAAAGIGSPPDSDILYFPCTGRRPDGSVVKFYRRIDKGDNAKVKALMARINAASPDCTIDVVHGVIKGRDGEIVVLQEGDLCFNEMNELREVLNKAFEKQVAPDYRERADLSGNPAGGASLQCDSSPRITHLQGSSAKTILDKMIVHPVFRARLQRIPATEREARIKAALLIDNYLAYKKMAIARLIEQKNRQLQEQSERMREIDLDPLREEIRELRRIKEELDQGRVIDRFALVSGILFPEQEPQLPGLKIQQRELQAFIESQSSGRRWVAGVLPTPFAAKPTLDREETSYIEDLLVFKATNQQELRTSSYLLGRAIKQTPKESKFFLVLKNRQLTRVELAAQLIEAEKAAGIEPFERDELVELLQRSEEENKGQVHELLRKMPRVIDPVALPAEPVLVDVGVPVAVVAPAHPLVPPAAGPLVLLPGVTLPREEALRIFHLPPEADDLQISRAFRRAASAVHPDRFPGRPSLPPEVIAQFHALTRARDSLLTRTEESEVERRALLS